MFARLSNNLQCRYIFFYFTGAEGEGVQVKFFQNPGYMATDLHTGILSTFYLTLT